MQRLSNEYDRAQLFALHHTTQQHKGLGIMISNKRTHSNLKGEAHRTNELNWSEFLFSSCRIETQ